ncbi:MAG: Lrp/AsnC family transcriptional regulator [Pseudomonadota bacterium]
MTLDRFDRQLLNLVQVDSTRTADQLSALVALSPSAIQRRLRRMKDDGVIIGEVAIVDTRHVGRPTFFIVSLQVERERPELLARLRGWLADQGEIQQVFYVTGEADFILVIAARDTEAFEALMAGLMADNPNVRRFTTSVALGVPKRSLFVPVAIDAE